MTNRAAVANDDEGTDCDVFLSRGHELLAQKIEKHGAAAKLARDCGVVPSALSQLAAGYRRYPSLPLALKLAHHAEIEIDSWEKKSSHRSQQ